MTDLPVICSVAMVQALLADRKPLTRRLAYRKKKHPLADTGQI